MSVTRIPGGSGSPTGRTPHDRSRRSPPAVGGELELAVADLERAGPRAHLGEPGGVEGHPGELAVEVPRLEVGLGEPVVDGVELDAPLVGLDDHPDLLEALRCTSTRIGPTEASIRSAPRVLEDRTTRWSSPHSTDTKASATLRLGYWPIADDGEQLVVGPVDVVGTVDVEVVAVVEVPVRGPDEPHGLGDLMDRVVVQGGEHGQLLGVCGRWDPVGCPVGATMAIGA